jgi:putative SOS response-associated peptidase YedK
MCNLYAMTKSQAQIARATKALLDNLGDMPPLPGIFPGYPAPIVRNAANGEREMATAYWGMASSRKAIVHDAIK